VVEKMKSYDISQLPVVDAVGRLIGIVSEVDLLDHLLQTGHVHDPEETITAVINPNVLVIDPAASLESLLIAFERGKVAIVNEDDKPISVLTKIDLIDYLSEKN
jgi:cystathionine beta-synthase